MDHHYFFVTRWELAAFAEVHTVLADRTRPPGPTFPHNLTRRRRSLGAT